MPIDQGTMARYSYRETFLTAERGPEISLALDSEKLRVIRDSTEHCIDLASIEQVDLAVPTLGNGACYCCTLRTQSETLRILSPGYSALNILRFRSIQRRSTGYVEFVRALHAALRPRRYEIRFRTVSSWIPKSYTPFEVPIDYLPRLRPRIRVLTD